MSDLSLPAEISILAMYDEQPQEHVPVLQELLAVARRRIAARWISEPTVLIVAPSSEVFAGLAGMTRIVPLMEALARVGQAAGIRIRLMDVLPLLSVPTHPGQEVPSLAAAGDTGLRQYIIDPAMDHITYHVLTPSEMSALAVSAAS